MKKQASLMLCLLLTIGGYAQKGFHLGVSGTFSSTWILNQNNYGTLEPFKQSYVKQSEMDYLATWGGNAGVVLGYNFTNNLGLQAEVQYNVTGQKYKDNFEGPAIVPVDTGMLSLGSATERVEVTRVIKLSYLQIPLMFKVITKKGKKVKFFFCIGPQIGFRTAASEQVKLEEIPYDRLALPPSEKFKTVDIGLAMQLGVVVFATDYLFVDIGLSTYGGLNDLNGKKLKALDWYSKNDVAYQKSYNFRAGLMAGVHYLFGVQKRKEIYLQY